MSHGPRGTGPSRQQFPEGSLDTAIGQTPFDILYTEDRVRLKYYRPEKRRHKIPLLVVYALINRETMLDLAPGRSVVERFLADGMEVYMIDWGYPSRMDRFLTIDDHVDGYMDNIVEFIRKRHDLPGINLMGVCMGGTFSVIYAALHPGKVKNLITTVTPTDFDTDRGLLHVWLREIDAGDLAESYGNIPGDLLNLGFLLLNPPRLMMGKYMTLLDRTHDRAFVAEFVRMERWIFDSPDLPGATFVEFVDGLYKENRLIRGKMVVGGRRVDLKRITMPLLNIYARDDHLVPPAASAPLNGAVGSGDTEEICLPTGHIGIYVSSRARELFAPAIAGWLRERE